MSTPPASSHEDGNGIRTGVPPAHSASVQVRSQRKPLPNSVPSPMLPKSTNETAQQKKVSRRSSKPIINWFQRKLAGTGKGKRTESVPLTVAELGAGRNNSNATRQMGRISSSPLPVPVTHHYLRHNAKPDAALLARRKTRSISLNGDEEMREFNQPYVPEDDASLDQSSLNRESIWSPASALEADDDASVRPIPPSAPPSPSPSRSSSSYLSDPRTFRSIAASTKPTTLLSIDLNGNGMAHIAQAPAQPTQVHRLAPHVRQSSSLSTGGLLSSGNSITFSALPSAQPSSRPTSLRNPGSLSSFSANTQHAATYNGVSMSSVQAPLHTSHHPRNNPRPSSPPLDNASVLTLASSAFGIPSRVGPQNYPPSAIGDSVSHYQGSIMFPDGESTSHFVLGEDERLEERDLDASVRALRPRSSRRGSWESEASRWSARVQGTGTSSLARERSLWTSNSIRTGAFSIENGEVYETADDQTPDTATGDIDNFDKEETVPEPQLEAVNVAFEQTNPLPVVNEHTADLKEIEKPIGGAQHEDVPQASHTLHRSSTETIAQTVANPNIIKDFHSEGKPDKEEVVEPTSQIAVLPQPST